MDQDTRNTNIGVFDSGFGGIHILRSIVKKLPRYNYIYLGDTARAPYGTRSQETIYEFTRQAVEFLFQKDCGIVILACNTASTVALRKLQQEFVPKFYPDRKVLGVLIPAIEEAIDLTQNGRIGVLATEATVASCAFPVQLEKAAKILGDDRKLKIFQQSAPLLVPIVETIDKHPQATKMILQKYLAPLTKKKIDTLILGCTHYGILEKEIKKVIGPKIHVVSEANVVAGKLVDYFARHPEIESKILRSGTTRFFTTDLTERFRILGGKFFGKKITPEKATLHN